MKKKIVKKSKARVRKKTIYKKYFLKSLIFLGIVCLFILGIFTIFSINPTSIKQLGKSYSTPTPFPSSTPTPTPTPNLIPFSPRDIDLDVSHWKTFVDKNMYNMKYSIKYPQTWELTKNDYYPIYYPYGISDEPNGDIKSPRVMLDAGGHGGQFTFHKETFPAGEALYQWTFSENEKQVYGIVIFKTDKYQQNIELSIPVKDSAEAAILKQVFDSIVSSFKPLE